MEITPAMDHQFEELNMKFLRFPVLDDSVKQLRKIITSPSIFWINTGKGTGEESLEKYLEQ